MHDRTPQRLFSWAPARIRESAAALLAVACLGAQAQAAAPRAGAQDPPLREFPVSPRALPRSDLPMPALRAPHTVGDDRLAELRGGTDTPWSDMKLNGTVGNNAASNVVTGANIITDGAFSNSSGLPMVIQNSGANVLIQNATIVNVQFR